MLFYWSYITAVSGMETHDMPRIKIQLSVQGMCSAMSHIALNNQNLLQNLRKHIGWLLLFTM